jgi:hypothetical protein
METKDPIKILENINDFWNENIHEIMNGEYQKNFSEALNGVKEYLKDHEYLKASVLAIGIKNWSLEADKQSFLFSHEENYFISLTEKLGYLISNIGN